MHAREDLWRIKVMSSRSLKLGEGHNNLSRLKQPLYLNKLAFRVFSGISHQVCQRNDSKQSVVTTSRCHLRSVNYESSKFNPTENRANEREKQSKTSEKQSKTSEKQSKSSEKQG